MKKLLTAFTALTLLFAPAAAQQPEDDRATLESQVPAMMEIVRTFMDYARENRLEQMMPREDLLRGLEGVLRPDESGYALAEEFYRMVRLTPEQEVAMRDFHLSREQLFAMLDHVMDNGLGTNPQDLDRFLTREQQDVVDNLQLSPEQMQAIQRLLSQNLVPMMDNLQRRTADTGDAMQFDGLLQMLMQLIPRSSDDLR